VTRQPLSDLEVEAPAAADRDSNREHEFRLRWRPRPSLGSHVESVWAERTSDDDPVLPDGAVELIWSGRGLFVRGADTRAHQIGAFPERTFVGIRFRPGGAADVLGLRGAELADARVGISALWGGSEMERLESALAGSRAPREAADVLEDAVAARVRGEPDPAVAATVDALRERAAPALVGPLADSIGLSERQLLRRCLAALGYGPKTLDRIFRFQRFRALAARESELGLAEIAAAVGYADQSHLTRECLRLAGETPATHRMRL
jgi:AraC-like DNA-binding protein